MKGWNEEKGWRRGIHGTTHLSFPLLSACCECISERENASHSSLWSSSASRGHGKTASSSCLFQHTRHIWSLTSAPLLALPHGHGHSQRIGVCSPFQTEKSFCVHLFHCAGLNPDNSVSHKSLHWHWGFADWISELGDNYFSISVIPAARIYSQFTVCNITHSHSSSSACSSSLLLSLPFLVAWGLSLHES